MPLPRLFFAFLGARFLGLKRHSSLLRNTFQLHKRFVSTLLRKKLKKQTIRLRCYRQRARYLNLNQRRSSMKPEHYKPIRKGKPKRKGKISPLKSRMLAVAQKWKPITSPKSREAYSTKIEWATKLIPKLKK